MKITNNLKFNRQKIGLTQAELAKMVGIDETHYQKIEYGTTKPNVKIALLLAQALQTIVEDLFPLPSDKQASKKQTLK